MIASALVRDIALRLRSAGVADAAQEAEELVRALLGLSKSLYLAAPPELTAGQISMIEKQCDRRIAGEPLHYILGSIEFMGLRIAVGPGVLIPRPETERLVEETIKKIKSEKREIPSAKSARQESESRIRNPENNASLIPHSSSPSPDHSSPYLILDLCTGSGCIALSLAHACPDALVWGTDISPQALSYSRQNAEANAIPNVTFAEGDLFAPVAGKRFRCITANPPYIKASDIRNLQVEIREHEPLGALDGGPDGLDSYRRILAEAPQYLEPGGMLILELGYDQADDVSTIAATHGFVDIRCLHDYAGIRRMFVGRVPRISPAS